jgi:arylsulfatase A-like enzyme
VLYSDHGMEFFEHGTWGQGNSALGDFSARVPLVLSGAGIPRGKVIGDVVRTVDIMPTLLDLLGGALGRLRRGFPRSSDPPARPGTRPQGLQRDRDLDHHRARHARGPSCLPRPARTARHCQRDISGSHPAELAHLLTELQAWMNERTPPPLTPRPLTPDDHP